MISSYVMPSRRILQLGDPLLRSVSAPVSAPSEAIPVFEDLRATLHDFRRAHGFGRGISAVQIGAPLRLIFIEFEGAQYAIRNPEYEDRSEEMCIRDSIHSIPGPEGVAQTGDTRTLTLVPVTLLLPLAAWLQRSTVDAYAVPPNCAGMVATSTDPNRLNQIVRIPPTDSMKDPPTRNLP